LQGCLSEDICIRIL